MSETATLTPERAADALASSRILRARIEERWQEEFHVIALDTRHQVLGCRMIGRGTADRCSVHPRDIFRFLFLAGPTCRFVAGHNHPSGDCSPSDADRDITRALANAGRLMGIELVDHVIVSSADHNPGAFRSLREERPDLFAA